MQVFGANNSYPGPGQRIGGFIKGILLVQIASLQNIRKSLFGYVLLGQEVFQDIAGMLAGFFYFRISALVFGRDVGDAALRYE
jgi:hypothetical protein